MTDEQVTRSVDLDADLDEVWRAVSDPGERARWLDDPDAAARRLRVDEVDDVAEVADGGAGRDGTRRLVWTWWHPGDEGDASTVSVVVAPRVGGGTRVVVTETLPAVSPVRARAGSGLSRTAWVGGLWDHRFLGLELLFLATRALAPVAVG
jgi:uncharacterized protein YndB with AHSA1/START domain